MKLIILSIFLILIAGCSTDQAVNVSGTPDLMLDEQDLQQLGMTKDNLQQIGMESDADGCHTEGGYTNIVDSSSGQYSICSYIIESIDNTEIIIELQKFADYEALNGTYQYSSSHLFSAEGIISKDEYGDQSIFRVNSEHDYGGEYNDPDVYYYHLWFTKDKYLIHITSKGSKEAEDYIGKIGQQILSKF